MSPFAETLYRDAGLGPADMDIWFMYDGFSFLRPALDGEPGPRAARGGR